MASSFLCCEIRQLLVHVYPGGSKAPGAERITVFYGRRGCPVKKPRFMPSGQHRWLRARPWPAFRPAGRHRGADRDARNPRTLATGHTMTATALTPMNQQIHQPSLLNRIARVLLCLVFIHAVIGKLTGFTGVAGAIAAKGLPLAPVLLLLFLVPTTLLFHSDVADKMERIQLFKNLAIMGGLLLVADQDSRA
jgi:putative oxidoreductase